MLLVALLGEVGARNGLKMKTNLYVLVGFAIILCGCNNSSNDQRAIASKKEVATTCHVAPGSELYLTDSNDNWYRAQ